MDDDSKVSPAVDGGPYAVFEAGPMESWGRWRYRLERMNLSVEGKCFLKDRVGLTGAEMSLNVFKPGESMPFSHRHRRNEELYLFLSGIGEMQLDDDLIPIKPGTVIRVDPEPARCWRNTGDEPLVFVVLQCPKDVEVGPTSADGVPARQSVRWRTGE